MRINVLFVVNLNYTEKSALISFPFEFLPLPKIGEEVSAVDRKGEKVCRAKVVKVLNKPKQDRTLRFYCKRHLFKGGKKKQFF